MCPSAGTLCDQCPLFQKSGHSTAVDSFAFFPFIDKEMLNSILGRDTRAFSSQLCPSNSKSETNLFKVHPRSDQILQELYKDGFVATRRVGGLAFDVSLHGRPVRLSPIGAPDRRLSRNGGSKKRKKNTHQKQSAKRKKKEQKRKRRRRRKTIDVSTTQQRVTDLQLHSYLAQQIYLFAALQEIVVESGKT